MYIFYSVDTGLRVGRRAPWPYCTCYAVDDADWAAFLRVLQRDLRGQVFLR